MAGVQHGDWDVLAAVQLNSHKPPVFPVAWFNCVVGLILYINPLY